MDGLLIFQHLFQTLWPGMDGLKGPILSGTCFYMKRESLYGNSIKQGNYAPYFVLVLIGGLQFIVFTWTNITIRSLILC